MKLFLEKSKCKFSESINGFVVEVETLGPIEFTGGDGGDYLLFDEDEEGIGPAPWEPFIIEKPKAKYESSKNPDQDLCSRGN